MFEFSSKTQVNRKFTLNELYRQIRADKDIKADSKVITSITLTNVLSERTMNFKGTGQVKEIYIFEVVLSEKNIPEKFLQALDKNIAFNTYFVLKCDTETKLYAAYKEKGENGMKYSKYYSTDWRNEKNITLPLNLTNLDSIYTVLFDELIPIDRRTGETSLDIITRYERIKKLEREIEKQQVAVNNETQPKKRFELNEQLKEKKKELEGIKL